MDLDRERRRWPREAPLRNEIEPPFAPVLEPLSFSTKELAPEDQLPAWQAHVASLIDIKLPDDTPRERGFVAHHTAWKLGRMLAVQQLAPAHSYLRSAAKLRSSSIDHWYVAVPRTGRSWTEVDGRVAEGKPGGVELRSLGYPFRGRTTDSETFFLYLPRDLFADASVNLDANNNSILFGNIANLLVDYLNGIETRLRSLTPEDLPRIVHATRSLIIGCLSPPGERDAAAEQFAGFALIERARRYIQQHLDAADLTPESVCRALGVSRTRLYQMFEPSGGVLHYIQKRRLLTAHAALSDPADNRRIIDIAETVGFSSAANFSRAFSKEFGYSPREARNAMAWPHLAHTGSSAEHEKSDTFDGWLKALGS
ncbi:helix-turn-helix domain-containing protein [Mesorhizobium sp. WSM2239]|uniref:Helix-turn-helix domain-containing protein n=2 Tax=unclassified Mesorhizobium TaxID=325217 RepID=A0AAU8DJD0_9HYPH